MTTPVIEVEFPARAEYVGLARLTVAAVAASRRDLPDDRIDDLKIAVSEACTNAVEAHAAATTDDRIVVRCHELDDRFEVEIQDRGAGFEPGSVPPEPPRADPDRLQFERGLGIPLIHTLVDEARFDSSGDGTTVTLVMRCGAAPAEDAEPLDLDEFEA